MSDPSFGSFAEAIADRYVMQGEIGHGSRATV